jgi:riboflavin biosynthesis pyrimidine reductase
LDQTQGQVLPLPPDLSALYGALRFPLSPDIPYLVGNFVSTLDGVVSLNLPGVSDGGPISGESPEDHLVMGLLRAVADAVIVGAGTVRAVSTSHRWTAAYICPELRESYQHMRNHLGKPEPPLNVIVTAHGELNLDQPLFQSGEVPVLIVTTPQGATRLNARRIPPTVQVAGVQQMDSLRAQTIVQAVCGLRSCQIILVEGGPQILGAFLTEHLLDELFLTLAPQIAGRDRASFRPGLVEGHLFAPEHPLWGRLLSVKRGASHLFLRYAFKERP